MLARWQRATDSKVNKHMVNSEITEKRLQTLCDAIPFHMTVIWLKRKTVTLCVKVLIYWQNLDRNRFHVNELWYRISPPPQSRTAPLDQDS